MRVFSVAILLVGVSIGSPALSQNAKSVSIVLDASGSMNARLPDGETRIYAAKRAVAGLVSKMSGDTRIALWAYGHRSPTQKKDCQDVGLLVDFAPLDVNKTEVMAQTQQLQARGYTPITTALTAAAKSIAGEESGERVVLLVSDGHETCATDPCVAARALAEADARLVIHTIGFGVGAAARTQLQCIANVARGTYFDANNAATLATTLTKATEIKTSTKINTAAQIASKKGPSRILIKNTYAGASHLVTRAEDGAQVANINGAIGQEEVPPGIYNVTFENGLWRGVEVKPSETTVLEVGLLTIEGGPSDINGYDIIDPETEQRLVHRKVIGTIPLMPGRFTISQGHLNWPNIDINAGQTTTLNPARIVLTGANAGEYRVTTSDGRDAGNVSRLFQLPLPAGSYLVFVEGQPIRIVLVEGQTHTIEVP